MTFDIEEICSLDCRRHRTIHPQVHENFVERINDIIYEPAMKQARVLDLACGVGVFGKACMDIGAYQYVGVDINKEEIDNGNRYFKCYDDVQLIHSSIEDFSILPEYDVIMLNGVIYLFDDPFEIVERAVEANPKHIFIETIVGSSGVTFDRFNKFQYAKIQPEYQDQMLNDMGYKNIRRRYHDISKGVHPMHNRFATVYERIDDVEV